MFEMQINVNIEAQGLAQAITDLAQAISAKGSLEEVQPAMVLKTGEWQTPVPMETAHLELIHEEKSAPVYVAPAPVQTQEAVPTPEPIQESAPATVQIDLATISRAGAALIDQGKMQDVLLLLQKYNVKAVNQLVESQYPAFAEDLKALGANF